MAKHLERDIERLKLNLLALGAKVEESVYRAVQAIEQGDAVAARRVIEEDNQIDAQELEVEEECLKILALHQPVATDLRFIVAVLKIDNDLERIGDLAVNLAERAVLLSKGPRVRSPFDLPNMAVKSQAMLRRSIDAFVNMNAEAARQVCAADDEVDQINREMYHLVLASIKERPDDAESLVHYLTSSRLLERISDHATNIAEDVIYLVEGEIVRHQGWKYRAIPRLLNES
ncbi:MAG: phosphate signaling complex protein PhoU [Candidatus Eisenbacteria bacterium]